MGAPESETAALLRSMSMGCTDSEDTEIFKPRSDERSYRRIILPNALQVLLISDRDTDKSAASLDVNVGSYYDPKELPGLAHFLEHALFFSSEKYPDEGSFRRFITEHGGSENAFTKGEHTNYHFQVGADHFEEALDRLAQFFISPLFTPDATSREIKAVNSENSNNLKSDIWRMSQLERHMSSREHPYHKFGSGNLETLEIRPKALGLDTRDETLKFYEAHYSSNLMCLALYGKETLGELQRLAEEKFSAVKNTKKNVVRFATQPCSSEHLRILVRAVPVADGHTLKLIWPIIPSQQNYREAPFRYVAHLIGQQARGSILALLKQLGWANRLWTWESDASIEVSGFFNVQMELTDVGQEHMEEIIGFIFQYLSILRKEGIARWIFEELKALRHTQFHYQGKGAPVSYVTGLAERMHLYRPEYWLSAELPRNFDFDVLSRAVQDLTPERMRIFWYSKQFQDIATEVEPWYSTQFTSKKIDEMLIKQWQSPEVDPRLHVPEANPFVPTDFSLVSDAEPKMHRPVLLRETNMFRLWYKLGSDFHTPKGRISMKIYSPEAYVSPEAGALTRLFKDLVNDHLNAYAHNAAVAGLSYRIMDTIHGLWFTVCGFNHKLISLITEILEVLVNFEVEEDRFEVIKERLLRACVNVQFEKPHRQARDSLDSILLHHQWDVDDLIKVIPNLHADNLRKMFPRCLSRIFVETFVAGNISSKEAEAFLYHVESILTRGPKLCAQPVFPSQLLKCQQRILRLEDGADFIHASVGTNPKDENSALRFYLQIGEDNIRASILLGLLVLTMDEGVWHQLRTVEQLGYSVRVTGTDDRGVRGIEFCIQSTVKDPGFLEGRVEAYLDLYEETVQKMSEEGFRKHVDTLIKRTLEKHRNVYEELHFFYTEIEKGTLQFDRKAREAASLQTIDKQAFVDFFYTYIHWNAPKRKKLSIHVYGSQHLAEYHALKQAACYFPSGENLRDPENSESYVSEDTEHESVMQWKGEGEVAVRSRAQLLSDVRAFKRRHSLYPALWSIFH